MTASNMRNLPIVIPAFNRPKSLARLLSSVARAHYEGPAPKLIVSIEGEAPQSVVDVAEAFQWEGHKEVIVHQERKGLRSHILWCGDLSFEYDGVVLLEDDLVVSPFFYEYAQQAVDYYEDTSQQGKIASYSLYSFKFNEFVNLPFRPLEDGNDVYFVQTCSSSGQIWTRRQWDSFRNWYADHANTPIRIEDGVPASVANWPVTSWKKYFNKYMAVNDLFSVVPKISLTTNFGDIGTNNRGSSKHQVPLLSGRNKWRFVRFSESKSVYDAYFEHVLERLITEIAGISATDIICDLYGLKDLRIETKDYVLTSKTAKYSRASFGNSMCPPIFNVIYGVEGNVFVLAKKTNVNETQQRLLLVEREIQFLGVRDRVLLALNALRKKFLSRQAFLRIMN